MRCLHVFRSIGRRAVPTQRHWLCTKPSPPPPEAPSSFRPILTFRPKARRLTEKERLDLPDKFVERLRQAFTDRSTTVQRYSGFAHRADKQGFLRAANCFRRLAQEESQIAQQLMCAIEAAEPSGVDPASGQTFGSTTANLEASFVQEMHDAEETLSNFSKAAQKAKVEELSNFFQSIADADRCHTAAVQAELEELDDMAAAAEKKAKGKKDLKTETLQG